MCICIYMYMYVYMYLYMYKRSLLFLTNPSFWIFRLSITMLRSCVVVACLRPHPHLYQLARWLSWQPHPTRFAACVAELKLQLHLDLWTTLHLILAWSFCSNHSLFHSSWWKNPVCLCAKYAKGWRTGPPINPNDIFLARIGTGFLPTEKSPWGWRWRRMWMSVGNTEADLLL